MDWTGFWIVMGFFLVMIIALIIDLTPAGEWFVNWPFN